MSAGDPLVAGLAFPEVDAEGRQRVAPEVPSGSETVLISHNFCDKTTWYTESTRITDEVATDSGDGLTWNLAGSFLIDLTHGKIHEEDSVVQDDIASGGGHGYAVIVKANSVTKVQRAPFAASGGDYTVDYQNGTITFGTSQAGNTILVSYSKAQGSKWKLLPKAGKKLQIEVAETQFSSDFIFNDTVVFEVVAAGGTVSVAKTLYKTLPQVIDEALGTYPQINAGGGSRGISVPYWNYPFRYGRVREISSLQTVELWLYLENDIPFGGERTTVSFHCSVVDDV